MNLKLMISVIIPNYNYGRFLGDAIQSVLDQTLQPIEIIIVDDGSTDNSVEIVKSFGTKVKLIQQKNGGVGKARNTGARFSTGNLLAFLDADDIWFPHKLEKQVELFQAQPELDYVSCGMREFDLEGKAIREYIPATKQWQTEGILLFTESIVASGSAIIVKRKAFEKIGGFDDQRDLHPSEDWDFARRISEVCAIGAVADILVNYRIHGNNGHLQISRFARSMTLAFEKAFNETNESHQNVKTQSYGNLHKVLAGSYFNAGQYQQFIKHSLRSLTMTPKNISYFARFPYRRLKRIFS
ncbi:MAG: glycosyltransferase [Pyrinomonadaceae bacterium]|nr:glycosyltransferase [Pyrinomonadaceae bacterium]